MGAVDQTAVANRTQSVVEESAWLHSLLESRPIGFLWVLMSRVRASNKH